MEREGGGRRSFEGRREHVRSSGLRPSVPWEAGDRRRRPVNRVLLFRLLSVS